MIPVKSNDTNGRPKNRARCFREIADGHTPQKRQKETRIGKFTVMIVAENKENVNTLMAFSEVSHKVCGLFVQNSSLFKQFSSNFIHVWLLLQMEGISPFPPSFRFSKMYFHKHGRFPPSKNSIKRVPMSSSAICTIYCTLPWRSLAPAS